MIPDFNTYLSESVWGDLRKKSLGQEVRTEDDLNLLDVDGMAEYVFSHYEKCDKDSRVALPYWTGKPKNVFIIPVANVPYMENKNQYRIIFLRVDCNMHDKSIHGLKLTIQDEEIPEWKELLTGFRVIKHHTPYDKFVWIFPKEGKLSASIPVGVFVNILDTILKGAKNPILRKKEVNESVWGDLRKKSLGQEVREEDNVNNLDEKALVDYINRHYEAATEDQKTFVIVDINKRITVLLYYLLDSAMMKTGDYMYLEYEPQKNLIYISQYSKVYDYPLFKKLCKQFDVKRKAYPNRFSNDTTISPKDGGVSNRFFLDVIDFFLDHAEHPFYRAIIKKDEVNESVWGDLRKKSLGQEERIEDNVNNLDFKEFFDYIKEKYGNLTYMMDWEPIFGDGWNICTVYINKDLEIDFRYPNSRKKKKEIYVMWKKSTISDEFVNKLGELFNVYDYRERSYLDIYPKEGPCENKTYVDAIEFFLNNKKIMCVR